MRKWPAASTHLLCSTRVAQGAKQTQKEQRRRERRRRRGEGECGLASNNLINNTGIDGMEGGEKEDEEEGVR